MKKSILYITTILTLNLELLTLNSFSQCTKLLDFAGVTNGRNPTGSLLSEGSFLYGLTPAGGSNNLGTIFKIMPDGLNYSKLFDFAGITTGSQPEGSLISDGTFLYGLAEQGGSNSSGVLFKIKPDGTGFTLLHTFGASGDGVFPGGSLFSDGTFLYGTTELGGTSNKGTLFKIMLNGTGYAKLLDFSGADGASPYGSLISDGTFLYGMTNQGGTNSKGVIFKIMTNGTGYSKLLDFNGANGDTPYGSLISDGTYLYGITSIGGVNNLGVVFKIKADGSGGYVDMFDFAGISNGKIPYGSFISIGNYLYGMTQQGGTNNAGTIFKIMPNGTGYTKMLDFANIANGSGPAGSFISDGTFLWGMAAGGGINGMGTLFKYCINPTSSTQSATICYGNTITIGNHIHNSTGTYNDNLTSHFGCDSSVTTHLIVLSQNTLTQSPTVCAGHSVTVGSHTYTTSGNYTDLFTSLVNGCDSTLTTHLTVFSVNSHAQSTSVCAGQSITVGSHTYNTSGTFTDIFTSLVNGCDSTVTSHLTVLTAITHTQSPIVCVGQSVSVGSHTYTTSGTYTDVLASLINGCDSTITTHLTVLQSNIHSQSLTVCYGDSLTVGTHTYTANGNYSDTLTSYHGCDSVISTHLTSAAQNIFFQSPSVCKGQGFTIGSHTYYINGTYTDVLTSIVNGCDSTVTTHLSLDSVDVSVQLGLSTLLAHATGATYQWIDCSNGNTPISGQIGQSFIAATVGNYAVIVTQNNCTDTSACFSLTPEGIAQLSINNIQLSVYPNPFNSFATITFSEEQKNINIKIINMLGEEIKLFPMFKTGKKLIIEKGEMKPGIYFLQAQTELGVVIKKIIIAQ